MLSHSSHSIYPLNLIKNQFLLMLMKRIVYVRIVHILGNSRNSLGKFSNHKHKFQIMKSKLTERINKAVQEMNLFRR